MLCSFCTGGSGKEDQVLTQKLTARKGRLKGLTASVAATLVMVTSIV